MGPMIPFFSFVADLCHLFFHKFFVYFTFFLSMENEGLKEGARPRIQMHPSKIGDRRWEEHVAGSESSCKVHNSIAVYAAMVSLLYSF